jgi:hypothetical protein
MLPESPMKMLAGLKLKSKKPITAPPRAADNNMTMASPLIAPTTKFVTHAKNATPPARPSSPSIRLIALMIATIHRTVIATPNTPMSRSPKKGSLIASIRKPQT